MSHLQLDALRENLLRAGFAPRHVRRYLGELRHHFDDLLRAETANGLSGDAAFQAARARLGCDGDLAAAMLACPALRATSARAPWLVFGIAPVFLTFATTAIVMALAIFAGWLGGPIQHMELGVAPGWFRAFCRLAALTVTFLMPLLIATMLVTLAARQRMTLLWPLIGIALVVAFGIHMDATFPGPGLRGGSLGLGFTVMPVLDVLQGHAFHAQWLFFLAQSGFSLLPVLWLLKRRHTPVSDA